jgi:hypothetical protein
VARNYYKVLSVEQHSVTLTDGTRWQGELCTFQCTRHGIEGAQIGDTVAADTQTQNPCVVINPFLEIGAAAAALRPAKFVPEVVKPFNPNDTGDAPFLTPLGHPMSLADIDALLRSQAKEIASLVGRVSRLEAFAPKHCSVCSAHIAAKGAFDK